MRLIDADKMNPLSDNSLNCYYGDRCTADAVKNYIDEQPTVNTNPIVWCFECKLRRTNECSMTYLDEGIDHLFDWTQDDGFCSWGIKNLD